MTATELPLRADERDDLARAARDDAIDAELAAQLEPAPRALQADLVRALGELSNVAASQTAQVGQRTYHYAGLADVLSEVRTVLARHDLALTQPLRTDLQARTLIVPTILLHSSGDQWLAGEIVFPLGDTAQATGSLITYARRYAIIAALGLAADDDDDGASAAPLEHGQPAARGSRPPRAAAQAQIKKIGALMDEAEIPADDHIRRALVANVVQRAIKSRSELTTTEASLVIDTVQAVKRGAARYELDDSGEPRIVLVGPQ